MGSLIFKSAKILLKGFDLSGDHNDLSLNYSSEMQDATTFGDNTRVRKGGLKTADISSAGFWEGGKDKVDDALFNRIGVDDELLTVFGDGINEGSTCAPGFGMQVVTAEYNPGGSIGDLLPFRMTAQSRSELVRATPLKDALDTPLTTGETNSTPLQTSTVNSGLKLFAGLHATAFATSTTGSRVDVTLQNSSSSGAVASFVDVLSFTQLTEIGGQFATPIVGPSSTDRDWWRVQACSCGAGVSMLAWMGVQ